MPSFNSIAIRTARRIASAAALVVLLFTAGLQPARAADGPAQKVKFDIAPQVLTEALIKYSQQSGIQVSTPTAAVDGKNSVGVVGAFSPAEALARLLDGTGLEYSFIDSSTVAVRAKSGRAAAVSAGAKGGVAEGLRLARVEADSVEEMQKEASAAEAADKNPGKASVEKSDEAGSKSIPEILVKGRRSLNTDIRRTEDAPQPYVVFDKEEIQRSQAVNLEEFLRTRLPMNTAAFSSSQVTGSQINTSSINLRGLGSNQTLILVDGRRMPGMSSGGSLAQPDINGIPLAAIERIEVLPSTAGGIYGGSATGGVVNIVLRRDFQGLEIKATYLNTFDTDAANMRLDASAGFSLEGGRTQVMIAATRSEANNLVIGDRDFSVRAIALQRKNNPSNFAALTTPPLGATVNIRGVGGALLVLKPQYGGTALGQAFTHLPLGYAGPASDSGAALVANAGRYNLDLPAGANGLERGLVAAPTLESASLNVRREFGARLEAFMDLSRLGNLASSFSANAPSTVANLPANAPNNPFQQAIAVTFPTPGLSYKNRFESTTVRATGGLIARLPHGWMGETSFGWSRSHRLTLSAPFVLDSVGTCVLGRGVGPNVILGEPGPTTPCTATADSRPALNILQEGNTFPIDFTPYRLPTPNVFNGPFDTILRSATLRLSGPVVNLPGGPLSLSSLIERRAEKLEDAVVQTINSTTLAWSYSLNPYRSQNADSYYLEARAPLISAGNARSWVRELELQVSVRRDDYKTRTTTTDVPSVPSREGPFPTLVYTNNRLDSTDYTLALRYAPAGDLALRASFGTGFLPPAVNQLVPTSFMFSGSMGSDPKRSNTPMYVGVPFTFIMGGNSDLKAEQSESASAGVILTPRFIPGLRLSIDYTRIEKAEEIQSPNAQYVLDNEDAFPGRIVRGPLSAADIIAGYQGGPITSFDRSSLNIANTLVEAYDIQAGYTWATARFGNFHGYAIGTRMTHYKNQVLPGAPVVDRVGFTGGPLEWRGNFGLDWNKGPLALSWNVQYYDSYWIYTALALPLTPLQVTSRATSVLNQGSAMIPSQVYHDLIATYRFDAATTFAWGFLANSELSFGIQNLLDESPPIVASTSPINAGYGNYGDPRLRRYTLSIRKSFGL